MNAQEAAEKTQQAILLRAKELGETVIHSWIFDLQDGSFNVKAIIQSKDGVVETVGVNIR